MIFSMIDWNITDWHKTYRSVVWNVFVLFIAFTNEANGTLIQIGIGIMSSRCIQKYLVFRMPKIDQIWIYFSFYTSLKFTACTPYHDSFAFVSLLLVSFRRRHFDRTHFNSTDGLVDDESLLFFSCFCHICFCDLNSLHFFTYSFVCFLTSFNWTDPFD